MTRFGFIFLAGLIVCSTANAANYILDNAEDSLVGEVKTVQSRYEDTLLDIARANGLGYKDIKLMNPGLDTWIPGEGEEVKLPLQFVLPRARRDGIVLNIPEMRLYYYSKPSPDGVVEVTTYPIGIGREGWNTPYANTKIIEKKKNPSWRPPKSIRKEHAEKGDPLPLVVKPGPDNPLGAYAMRLGLPSYLIHGTNKPSGIGMRVSHGCIRLYPEDIEALYQKINLGTRVRIVNQPYKVGSLNGKIFLEAHPFLDEDAEVFEGNLTSVVSMLVDMTEERQYDIDWDLAKEVINNRTGTPVEIGAFIYPEEEPVQLVSEQGNNTNNNIGALELRLDTDLSVLVHE